MTVINKITASLSYLSKISERFGSPFYLFDPDVFEKNFNDLLCSFQNFYPKTKIAYSYKTNYLPRICRQANSLGAYAEVVSRFEYEIAIQSGINPQMIIFNGPLKTKDDLHEALLAGAIVNVDSPYEVSNIQKIALEHPDSILRVGIRCAFKSKALPPTRFGIDPYSRTFWQIVQQLRKRPNIFLLGLHCHFLPHERSPKSYRLLCEEMLILSKQVFQDKPPRFLDIGGGFFSRMAPELQKQFLFRIPTFQEYAETIGGVFQKYFQNSDDCPELIIEPGLALVADTMKFVARVVDIKETSSGRFALLNGSIYNIKPTKNKKNLPVKIVSSSEKKGSEGNIINFAGYTCMEDDILYTGFTGQVKTGDFVIFDNVGAYTLVLKPPFIQPCPPVLMLKAEDTNVVVIIVKEKESPDYLLSTFCEDDLGDKKLTLTL